MACDVEGRKIIVWGLNLTADKVSAWLSESFDPRNQKGARKEIHASATLNSVSATEERSGSCRGRDTTALLMRLMNGQSTVNCLLLAASEGLTIIRSPPWRRLIRCFKNLVLNCFALIS